MVYKMESFIALSYLLLISSIGNAVVETKSEESHASVSSSTTQSPSYKTEMHLHASGDDCVEHVMVTGDGFSDTFKLPCTKDKQGRVVVNEDDKLVIGGEPGDTHGILGNKPNTLVVLTDGKCKKKVYTPGGNPKETFMSDEDCAAAKKEMKDIKEKSRNNEESNKLKLEKIGQDLDVKTLDLKMDFPTINIEDHFQSMDLDSKI